MVLKVLNVNTNDNYRARNIGNPRSNFCYYNQNQNSATFSSKKEDNSLSFIDGAKSFTKGLISPITGMFKSAKSFALGMATMVGSAALVLATGGAAAPLLVTAGLTMGAFQGVRAIGKLTIAKTKEQKEEALFEAGGAVGTIGLSAAGAKSSIKQIGVDTSDMNVIKAVATNVKRTPDALKGSFDIFSEGIFKDSFKNGINHYFAKPYQKGLAKEINLSVTKNQVENFNLLKDYLPPELADRIMIRAKGVTSAYDKLKTRSNFDKLVSDINKNKKLTPAEKEIKIQEAKADVERFKADREYAKGKVDDALGFRIEVNDPAAFPKIADALINAHNDGKFEVALVKNYRGELNENGFYFDKGVQEALEDNGIASITDVKPTGYCASQVKIKFKNGDLCEFQIRGRDVGEVAEVEHLRYDINQGKDIYKGHTELIKIFSPYKKALLNLNDAQKATYDKYFVSLYNWARNRELGIKSEKPNLPEGLDNVLSFENMQDIHNKYVAAHVPSEQYYSLNSAATNTYSLLTLNAHDKNKKM